ncbi:MAG: DUF763 domain-containing protein [Patescibacteria group bacterium]
MKTGWATTPLDYGKCPKWLFERMKKLGGIVAELIIEEYGEEEFLKRISHPVWFQSLGCLLAFDWNSSGLTVVLTAALKEAFKERNLGIYIAGGKGKTSRKTPEELLLIGEKTGLDGEKYSRLSKLVAKIDNSLIQDGFNLYHHVFILTKKGSWAVIQQGMNTSLSLARRYHWYNPQNLIEEPHQGIASDIFLKKVLNLTAKESKENREGLIKVLEEPKIIREMERLNNKRKISLFLDNIEFNYHPVVEEKFDIKRIQKSIEKAKFLQPKTLEDLLLIEGIGPKTIRALSLAVELIYGAKPSFNDPARYTFAHGGKDGTPYFVDRKTYDETIRIFKRALEISKKRLIY